MVYIRTCYRISYIKDRDSPRERAAASRIYRRVTHLRRSAATPHVPGQGNQGDVLFDGVSKREILTEQLSPAGIMWADVGGARFDFHGISGERGSMAKEQVERRNSDEEDDDR